MANILRPSASTSQRYSQTTKQLGKANFQSFSLLWSVHMRFHFNFPSPSYLHFFLQLKELPIGRNLRSCGQHDHNNAFIRWMHGWEAGTYKCYRVHIKCRAFLTNAFFASSLRFLILHVFLHVFMFGTLVQVHSSAYEFAVCQIDISLTLIFFDFSSLSRQILFS